MFFDCEQEFFICKCEAPPSRFLILKNWSNKVNGIQSNFKKYVYICVEFYNYENDYIHKNGIVAKHIIWRLIGC